MSERKLVRVKEKGQVRLPAEIRKRLGLKKGDLVAVVETPDGVLITPRMSSYREPSVRSVRRSGNED